MGPIYGGAMASDYLDSLAKVPLFALCSRDDLARIAQAADAITVDAGRVLVTEGERGTEAFVIVEGQASVTRDGEELAKLGPGAPFGELALIEQTERNATVAADTYMELLVIGSREFSALMDESAEFRRSIMAALADRLRKLDRALYG